MIEASERMALYESEDYLALLSVMTHDERKAVEHPSAELLVAAAKLVGVDAVPGLAAIRKRYSPEVERQSLSEVTSWAERVRSAVRAYEISG